LKTAVNANDQQPLVSIVMPVYNGARTLHAALNSVMGQTYTNFECIVLDNCSNDETGHIACSFADRDSRFRCVRNASVLPVMQNHNAVVARMSPAADYCQILQADDALEATCLADKVALARRFPDVGLVACYSLWGDRRVPEADVPFSTEQLPGREAAGRVLRGEFYPFLSPSSVLLRADLVRRRGKLYEETVLHGDVQAAYEILEETDFGFVPKVLVRVGRSAQSVTSRENAPLNRNLAANLQLLVSYGPKFLPADKLASSVNSRLRHYYATLARAALEGRSTEFWDFHRGALDKAGYRFQPGRLARAVAERCWRKPKGSARLVIGRFRRGPA
jgi:glycosyltransferase involved in cell wall biosynthesis